MPIDDKILCPCGFDEAVAIDNIVHCEQCGSRWPVKWIPLIGALRKAPVTDQPDETPWAQIVSDLDLAHSWVCPEDIGKEFEVIWDKHGKEIMAKLLTREAVTLEEVQIAVKAKHGQLLGDIFIEAGDVIHGDTPERKRCVALNFIDAMVKTALEEQGRRG